MQPDPLMRALESETIEDFAGNIRELLALAVMACDRATLATARPAVVAVEMMEAAIDAGYHRDVDGAALLLAASHATAWRMPEGPLRQQLLDRATATLAIVDEYKPNVPRLVPGGVA